MAEARRATVDDIGELIRLRQVMFDSMADVMDTTTGWEDNCAEVFRRGMHDGSVAAFVVDAPEGGGRELASCGVATVAARLPGPGNLHGS